MSGIELGLIIAILFATGVATVDIFQTEKIFRYMKEKNKR